MDTFSLNLLKIYRAHSHLTLGQLRSIIKEDEFLLSEPVSLLKKEGYLRVEHNYSIFEGVKDDDPDSLYCPLELTFRGRAVLDEECKISRKERTAWIRYAITTTIAVAGFIKSFFF